MKQSLKCAGLMGGFVILPMSVAAAEPAVNALDYPGPAWSPYVVGAGIGVLSWLTFYFSNKAIGASSFYAHLAGFLGTRIAPRRTKSLVYFKDNPPGVGWGFAFVAAAIVGGAIAALTGGEFTNEWLPPMWEARFGDSIALRGYCPGTAAAALGQGNWDVLFGMAGLIAGSWVFAELSGWSKRTIEQRGDLGKVLLPDLLRVPRGVFVVILALVLIVGLFVLERTFSR